jgi:heat shock protein HspQ
MTKTLSKTVPEPAPGSRAKPRKKPANREASAAAREIRIARYQLGDVVKHRVFPFRGVIFDIDPVFNNTEEWWLAIPAEVRPRKDQPFYHLYAENEETEYVAYVSEQNLLPDSSGEPVRHPQVAETFEQDDDGRYRPRDVVLN